MPEKEKEEKPEKTEKKTKKLSQAEFEKKVLELAGKELTSEKIGETLRQQNIHPNDYKDKISKILKNADKHVDADMKNIESKLEKIKKHFASNKQDKRAMREKDRVFAQLRKTKIYLGLITKKKKR